MADVEVEDTLREIRERVLAASEARAAVRAYAPVDAPAGDAFGAPNDARMGANISTTGRAWSRLPPVLTYRRGAPARVELWLKRLIKRAAHWFTWEQVNFNSAAHHALADARDALEAQRRTLEAQGRALEALREEVSRLRAEIESDDSELNLRVSEMGARVSSVESRFESELAGLRGALASAVGEQRARSDELSNELRDRTDAVLEEQRVCFRQLSLEAGELAVAHDRARRQLDSRIEALEKTVKSDA